MTTDLGYGLRHRQATYRSDILGVRTRVCLLALLLLPCSCQTRLALCVFPAGLDAQRTDGGWENVCMPAIDATENISVGDAIYHSGSCGLWMYRRSNIYRGMFGVDNSFGTVAK